MPRRRRADRLQESSTAAGHLQFARRVQQLQHQLQLGERQSVKRAGRERQSSLSLSHLLGRWRHADGRLLKLRRLIVRGRRIGQTRSRSHRCADSRMVRLGVSGLCSLLVLVVLFTFADAASVSAAAVCVTHRVSAADVCSWAGLDGGRLRVTGAAVSAATRLDSLRQRVGGSGRSERMWSGGGEEEAGGGCQ